MRGRLNAKTFGRRALAMESPGVHQLAPPRERQITCGVKLGAVESHVYRSHPEDRAA